MSSREVNSSYRSLAVVLLLVVAASALAASFGAGEWYYARLVKPSWTPPAWLFGFLGALAFTFLALSAWSIWQTGHSERKSVLTWWLLLLALAVCWSALFFGLNRTGWAWVLATLALAAAVWCFILFRRISEQASWLLAPWLAWAAFVWCFNLASWSLSGGILGRLLG